MYEQDVLDDMNKYKTRNTWTYMKIGSFFSEKRIKKFFRITQEIEYRRDELI